ncbi:MAG: hypothetical protein LBV11_11580 [Bacillus cereus]|nr:hypothetical protein [Bacillus cereus]
MDENPFKLNLTLNLSQIETSTDVDNKPSLTKFTELQSKGYYFFVQPKTSKMGEPYFWIIATKKGEDREEFSLKVNDAIVDYVIFSLMGVAYDIYSLETYDIGFSWWETTSNFEMELYKAEKAEGKTMKKSYSSANLTISSYYKNGVIVYKPYNNPEFKAYLNA